MPEQQRFQEMLEQLHAELQRADALDDRSRKLLNGALRDMEHLLKRAEGPDKRPESITDRLREGGSRVALGD